MFHCPETLDYRKAHVRGFNASSGRHLLQHTERLEHIKNYNGIQKSLTNSHLNQDETLYILYTDLGLLVRSEDLIVPCFPHPARVGVVDAVAPT